MTIELVKILEAALENAKLAESWFENYVESADESDWNICARYNERVKGLLEAYEIMTGEHVNSGSVFIQEELLAVA